jgi:hypothetical protein
VQDDLSRRSRVPSTLAVAPAKAPLKRVSPTTKSARRRKSLYADAHRKFRQTDRVMNTKAPMKYIVVTGGTTTPRSTTTSWEKSSRPFLPVSKPANPTEPADRNLH